MDISTTTGPLKAHFERLKVAFSLGKSRPIKYRKQQLQGLSRFLNECENEICDALFNDLHKSRFESLTSEIGILRTEIRHVLENLDSWAMRKRVPSPLAQFPATSNYAFEPKGVVLVLAPWNFPIQLSLAPLISAISAGNTAILKPSELAPHTSKLLSTKLTAYLDANCYHVFEGDQKASQELLKLRFDHIFFTGSTQVGKIVMQAAAQNLVPVTLELGGKSPCIVDESSDIDLAARRIAWGKLLNCGQVCLAPDFVLVQKSISLAFTEAVKKAITATYGRNPKESADYGRIVSQQHALRLQSLLIGQEIEYGGEVDLEQRYVAPTIVSNPNLNSPIMQEEIFGPILPIVEYVNIEDTLSFLQEMERPLAVYIFSRKKAHIDLLRTRTVSGAFCVNDTISHVAVPSLPFGGVGSSGMGSYHGRDGFEALSYKRAFFEKSTLIDIPLRYAPYSDLKARIAGWFQR